VKAQQAARIGIAGKIKARGGGDAGTSLTESNAEIGWAAADPETAIPMSPKGFGAAGHLLRWRSERGLLYFHHGMLV
jgi:hypothetical protein